VKERHNQLISAAMQEGVPVISASMHRRAADFQTQMLVEGKYMDSSIGETWRSKNVCNWHATMKGM
jgi:hypothetical protein